MATKTIKNTQIAPLMHNLEVSRDISRKERRDALKLKLKNKLDGKNNLFVDTSGNDAFMLAEKRALIREHIAKVAIMKQMGIQTIPTFAEVWEAFLERINNKGDSGGCCSTSNCGCGSSH